MQIAKNHDVKIVVAGPAFASGRYGFACVEICHFLSSSLGLYCVTSMFNGNPAVDTYRQYKDRSVFLFPTTEALLGMEDVLSRMAQFVIKLASGSVIGPPSEEGYIPRGFRAAEVTSRSAAERAVDMLLERLAGRPFTTEIPVQIPEAVPVTRRVSSLKDAYLALVTTAGIVPLGNPCGFTLQRNSRWEKYPIDKLDSMQDARWDVVHGGYNTIFMCNNVNYGIPLDVCRELEREGVFRKLYPYFYSTPGCGGLVSAMQTIGREMVSDMKAEGVDAVLLVST
jgi:glycine reductase